MLLIPGTLSLKLATECTNSEILQSILANYFDLMAHAKYFAFNSSKHLVNRYAEVSLLYSRKIVWAA